MIESISFVAVVMLVVVAFIIFRTLRCWRVGKCHLRTSTTWCSFVRSLTLEVADEAFDLSLTSKVADKAEDKC